LTKGDYKVNLDSIGYTLKPKRACFLGIFIIMKSKWVIFAVPAVFLLLVINSGSVAVYTAGIEKVRNKNVLDSEDFQIIDNFVGQAMAELVETRDFSDIGKIRMVILSHSSPNKESARVQYATQFYKSAHKYISEALKEASRLTAEDRKFVVTLNLLILIDGLLADAPENLQLANLAIGLLNDDKPVIRYWAVHSLTNAGITRQLNSAEVDNSELARRIAEQLQGLVEHSSPEIIVLMAEFAADVNVAQAEDLLLRIADMRIKRYANWTVEYELLDSTVLKSLCENISSAGQSKPAIGRRFGLLYSYAMQRYIKGRNYLSATQKQQLASVLAETEDKCVHRLLDKPQSTVRKAVGRDDYETLLLEHSRLLGDETRAGQLARKLNFHYGVGPNGNKRTAPPPLTEPPKTDVSE